MINLDYFQNEIEKIDKSKPKYIDTPAFEMITYETNSNDLKNDIEHSLINKNFIEEFEEYIYTLLETTENQNLFLLNQNIETLKLENRHHCVFNIFDKNLLGSYYHNQNKIVYYDIASLGHELLHAASTNNLSLPLCPQVYSGFQRNYRQHDIDIVRFKGLNEGYTELLSRKKFFNEDYNTPCYTANVYSLRLLDLLFEKNELETAYFNNCTEYVYKIFCKYANDDEFYWLNKYLDIFANSIAKKEEVEKVFNKLKEILKRTYNNEIEDNADNIIDEYYKNNPKMKVKKLY